MSPHPFDSADAVAELSALYELSFLRYSGSLADFAGEALEKALRLFGIRRFALWVGPPDARRIYLLSGLRDERSALSLARAEEPNRFVEALGADGSLGLLLMEQVSAIAPKERRFYNIYASRVEDGLLAAKGEQERQETLKALALSEERHRMLFQQSLDAISIGAPDGTAIEVNQAWLDLFGYKRDDLPGFEAIDLYVNPEDREQFVQRIAETGYVQDEVRFRKKDGTVFDCQRTLVVLKDESGAVVAYQGIMRDITERKRAEAALRESEEKYRTLFQLSRDATYLVKPDGTFIEVNQAWLDILGCSPEDVASFNAAHWYADPAERAVFRERMAAAGDVLDDEVQLRRKDGTVFDCQRRNVAQRDEHGNIRAFQGVMRDVTEIRNAERALRKSEEEYRSLFEQSMEPTMLVEVDGSNVRANQAWLNLFGYSREELPKLNIVEVYANPEDRKDFLHRIAQTGVIEDEVRFKKKDGTVFDCQRRVVAWRDERGNIRAFQAVMRDVTERKKAERVLRESEGRFRELSELLPQAICETDLKGNVIFANRKALEVWGHSQEDLERGVNIRELIAPEDLERAGAEFAVVLRGEGGAGGEYMALRKDGTTFPVQVYSNSITRGGEVVGVRAVLVDISDRKKVEQELRASEEQYRSLFEQSMDAIYIVGYDGSNFRANQAWLNLFGYSREELPKLNTVDVYENPNDRKDFLRRIAKTGVVEDEVRFKKKDGTVFDCQRTVSTHRDERGRIIEFQGVMRDVTERRNAERALRESEEEYRSLFELSIDPILVVGVDGSNVRANQAWLNLFGYSREELPNLNMLQFYANPDDRKDFLRRMAETGHVEDEVRFKKKDGTVMECQRATVARKDERGNVVAYQGIVRDITKQKRAQQALKDSEEKYRSLFEQSMDAVCLVAVDGTLLDANPAYLRLYRLDGGAIGHSNSRERYVRAADREEFLRRMEQRGAVRDEEVQMKKADGTVMDCLRTAIAIRDKTGRIVAFQSVVRDITEQKRAQQELRSSEEKYRTLFEQSMDAVALVAADGTLLDANPAYLRLFGFDAGAIGHSNVQDRYVEAADRSRFLQWMEKHGAIHDEELRHRKVDGTVMDCLRSSVATRDETGRIVRFQTVVRDITEQKRAQQALKDSEEKFRSLFEQSMDAIVVSASDGSNMDANQAWLDLFGYTRDELPGLNAVVMYVDPKDRKDFLRKIAKTGVLVDEEVRLKKKDGSVMDCVRTVVAKKDSEGNVVAWQGVIHDITRRKRMEQQLVEANRELRELTARLETAHEEERAEVAWELHDHVAQTLSVLKLDVASCRSRLPEEAPASLASTMDGMTHLLDETIERLRRLYTDLVPVMLEDLGLAATIEWQAEEFTRVSGVECDLRRVEDIKLPRGRVALGMFRVLQEALDNVRRHSGATKVTVDFERDGGEAVLRVADNGRGFTRDKMRKSGALGLAGIQERAQSWGGRVTIRSSVGAGTVLEATAPLEEKPAVRTAPESPGI